MKAFLLGRPWLTLPLLVVLLVGGFFGASALLTTCDTRQPGELSRKAERRVKAKLTNARNQARADSARAAQALAHAQVWVDSTHIYSDSLTLLRQHETAIIHLAPADTARLQRLWADVFGH